MRIEKIEDKIIVWETGRQNNEIIYQSTDELTEKRRKTISLVEVFLREKGEIKEADKLVRYLGKMIRINSIPKLIPTGNYRINSGLAYLKDSIERYQEEYNLDLDPDFQRGHVWSDEQRLRFVEFILQGGKSNPIYFNHPGWMNSYEGEMVIVDGKQRLTALLMFLNNEIAVFKNLDKDGIGYYASEFDYMAYDIEIVINNLKTKDLVLEWYLQMNKGNVAHTEAEIEKVEKLLELEKNKNK